MSNSHTLDGLALPDLIWVDEFDHRPVAQSTARAVNGALLVETAAMPAGRPITLQGGDNYAITTYSVVQALQQLAAVPGKVMTLQLADGRSFSVLFADQPLQARPKLLKRSPAPSDPYTLTLKFLTVNP